MNEERFIELVDLEISGTITPDERRELYRYLQKEPGAQNLYREIHQTSELLSGVRDVEPPAHLKTHIMNSVDFSRYKAPARSPVLRLLLGTRRLGVTPRFAYAFALGVVVGLVVYSAFLTRPAGRYGAEVEHLYGTIGLVEDADLEPVEQVPIDLAQVVGDVNLLRFADVLMFRFRLRTPHGFEVLMEYDSHQARFDGLRPVGPGSALLETGENYVRTSGSGDGAFSLAFVKETRSAASVDLNLMISDETVYRHTFIIPPGDEIE